MKHEISQNNVDNNSSFYQITWSIGFQTPAASGSLKRRVDKLWLTQASQAHCPFLFRVQAKKGEFSTFK